MNLKPARPRVELIHKRTAWGRCMFVIAYSRRKEVVLGWLWLKWSVVQPPTPAVFMLKCPWARYWTPTYSQWLKKRSERLMSQSMTQKNRLSTIIHQYFQLLGRFVDEHLPPGDAAWSFIWSCVHLIQFLKELRGSLAAKSSTDAVQVAYSLMKMLMAVKREQNTERYWSALLSWEEPQHLEITVVFV